MGNVQEYAEKLDEYDKKKRLKAKVFNPKDVVKTAKAVLSIEDPELGAIKYGILSMNDLLEIGIQAKSNEDRSVMILYRMLKKGYPDLTEDDVRNLPMDTATKLLTVLTQNSGFLQAPKK